MAHSGPRFATNCRQQAERLVREAHVFYFISKHPRTRWYVKWVATGSVGYLFSPVQLMPNFIPVIGFLDDFLVLFVGAKIVERFTPPDLLRECRELADASETRRRADVRPGIARFTILLTAASWLLLALVASALVAAYIYR